MLKRRLLVSALLFASCFLTGAIAQAPPEKIDLEAINKIKEEGLKKSQVMDLVSYMTDVYGPRLTNSPLHRKACDWAKGKLTSWGLQNAQLESWGPFGRGWTLDGFACNMTAPSFSPLIGYPKAWSPSTNGVVRGDVVYLNAKSDAELEAFKGKIKGAIVLIAAPASVRPHFDAEGKRYTDETLLAMANADPPGPGGRAPTPLTGGPGGRRFELTPEQRAAAAMTQKKWKLCYDEGAAVVLEPSRGGDGGSLFIGSVTMAPSGDANTGQFQRSSPWTKDARPAIPQFVVSPDYYNRMIRILERGAAVKAEAAVTARFHEEDLNPVNVIAEIPGTDLKDEIVMVGAHYDSWHAGTGATDNAAGCAVAMEAMRIIKTLGLQPRRTIRIGLWSGEEQGLLGSRAHVAKYYGSGGTRTFGGGGNAAGAAPRLELKPDHARFSAYFNLDNGTGKVRGIYLQGNEACRPIFRAWLAPFKELGAATITAQNTGGTDHQSFDGVGLPGFQFIQDPIEYSSRTHHTNIDNYDRIIEDDLKQAATIMASFAYNAAMRDQKLPRKPLPGQPVPPAAQPK